MHIKLPAFSRHLWVFILSALFILLLVSLSIRGVVLRKATASLADRLKDHHYSAHFDGAKFKGTAGYIF